VLLASSGYGLKRNSNTDVLLKAARKAVSLLNLTGEKIDDKY
jgi:hypothetical protein